MATVSSYAPDGKRHKQCHDEVFHTLQSVDMSAPLQPTPWRTCRVLANRPRLRLLKLLFHRPDQSVSELARQSGLQVAAASQYLRALNARGLLQVTRTSRWVRYRIAADDAPEPIAKLLRALRASFSQDRDPVEKIFRLATNFTHPRRVEIWQPLRNGAQPLEQLQAVTRISSPALARHLMKMQVRGLIAATDRYYRAVSPRDPMGRALAELAGGS
jgi:DNA-binding transcriptional ArsR family regulator